MYLFLILLVPALMFGSDPEPCPTQVFDWANEAVTSGRAERWEWATTGPQESICLIYEYNVPINCQTVGRAETHCLDEML